jgi:hypothetical protein
MTYCMKAIFIKIFNFLMLRISIIKFALREMYKNNLWISNTKNLFNFLNR